MGQITSEQLLPMIAAGETLAVEFKGEDCATSFL
ncbi:hypothetical protein Tther_02006 [Tepidimonas thermarum]|uniref:Uncharacterized protein n=1 Tax=Tepidimonas thermarum TaxID=335431 RepID=A0A554WYD1_9BURK|nr:hypothetical protein Tther_02006 [Tepidimonas thermarum]